MTVPDAHKVGYSDKFMIADTEETREIPKHGGAAELFLLKHSAGCQVRACISKRKQVTVVGKVVELSLTGRAYV